MKTLSWRSVVPTPTLPEAVERHSSRIATAEVEIFTGLQNLGK